MINSALRFPSPLEEWGSTTSNIPLNPGIPHIPALPSPVDSMNHHSIIYTDLFTSPYEFGSS